MEMKTFQNWIGESVLQCMKPKIQYMLHDMTPVTSPLKGILPLEIRIVKGQCFQLEEYKSLIALHHYLGYHMPAGENINYLGLQSHTLPVIYLVLSAAVLPLTGMRNTDIRYICWRPMLRPTGFVVYATRRLIGGMSEKQWAGAGMTGMGK